MIQNALHLKCTMSNVLQKACKQGETQKQLKKAINISNKNDHKIHMNRQAIATVTVSKP